MNVFFTRKLSEVHFISLCFYTFLPYSWVVSFELPFLLPVYEVRLSSGFIFLLAHRNVASSSFAAAAARSAVRLMDLTVCRRAVAVAAAVVQEVVAASLPPSLLCSPSPSRRRLRLKSVLEVDGGGDGNTTNDTAARTSSAFYSISGNTNHRCAAPPHPS